MFSFVLTSCLEISLSIYSTLTDIQNDSSVSRGLSKTLQHFQCLKMFLHREVVESTVLSADSTDFGKWVFYACILVFFMSSSNCLAQPAEKVPSCPVHLNHSQLLTCVREVKCKSSSQKQSVCVWKTENS